MLAGIALAACATAALGAGFQTSSTGVKAYGSRNAGAAAAADSPATLFFNPAGLLYLKGSELEAGLNLVSPSIRYEDRGSATPLGTPQSGSRSGDAGDTVYIPNLYLTHRISETLAAGLGASAPYGFATHYPRDWTGRYQAVDSSLTALNLEGALAWRPWAPVALGLGVDVAYGTVELTNAVDLGTLVAARAAAALGTGLGPGAAALSGNPALDGYSKIEGDDWGIGWNLGLMLDLSPRTRLGVAWRSKIDLELSGPSRTEVPDSVVALTGGAVRSGRSQASAGLTLPPTLSLGLRHDPTPRWTLLAGATWTGWHVFEDIRIGFSDGRADFVESQDWNDTWRASIGAELHVSERWTLRAGLEYDQTPIPDSAARPRIPEQDQQWVALGLTWQPAAVPGLAMDLAYTRILIGSYELDAEEATTPWLSSGALGGGVLRADYDTHADVLAIGLRWRFQ